jgi:hypothetical protein
VLASRSCRQVENARRVSLVANVIILFDFAFDSDISHDSVDSLVVEVAGCVRNNPTAAGRAKHLSGGCGRTTLYKNLVHLLNSN